MNYHNPQPDVKIIGAEGPILEVGSKTSYPSFDGAALSIGPSGLSMVVSLPNPTRPEIRALKRGAIESGLMLAGGSAVALWRFGDKTRPVTLETPFHIGLLPPADRWIPKATGNGETHPLLIIVQDGQRICRVVRLLPLSPSFSHTIERIVAKQAKDASQPGWTRAVHEADIDRYFEIFNNATEAMNVCEESAATGGRNPLNARGGSA